MKTHPSEMIPAKAMRSAYDGKFKAKLDRDDRLGALAAIVHGVRREVVARAFGVDRRTISHMANTSSKHYRDIRQELNKLGNEDFVKKYFTESVLRRIQNVPLGDAAPQQDVTALAPNPRAKSKAGIQVVRPEQCRFNHRVEIKFWAAGDDHPTTGWWYRDLDGDDPEKWLRNDDESLMTSQACLIAAEANLTDPMP